MALITALKNDNETCNKCIHNSEPIYPHCSKCEELIEDDNGGLIGVCYHNFEDVENDQWRKV